MNSTEIFEIERSLWSNDPTIYRERLHDDALLVFRETGVITRDDAVAAIRELNSLNHYWAEVSFADQRVLSPTSDTCILVYRAIARWNYADSPQTVLCSSIYTERSGQWRVVFHQQTPVGT
jgi:hypothetical protein